MSPMLPDKSVTHVPGLYPLAANDRFGDAAYALRQQEWHAFGESLCGKGAAALIDALAGQPSGSRTVVVPFGDSKVSSGQLAASLILRSVCCSTEVRMPPTQVVVSPDRLTSRMGYLDFRISTSDVKGLLNAWRVRAVAAGRSPGDFTAAEHSLLRREKRAARGSKRSPENLHLFFPAYRFPDGETLATVASRDHLRTDENLPALTFIDPAGEATSNLKEIGLEPEWVIVDLTTRGPEFRTDAIDELRNQFPRAHQVCLVPGLANEHTDKLRGRGYRLCWLNEAGADGSSLRRLECVSVEMNAPQEDLDQLLSLSAQLRRAGKSGGAQQAAFVALRTAMYVLTALPVERRFYDAAAVQRYAVATTAELLESLVDCERVLAMSDPAAAAALEEARSILASIASIPEGMPSRKRQLVERVGQAIATGSGLHVVVKNRTTRSAVEACLSKEFETDVSELSALGVRVDVGRDVAFASVVTPGAFLWTSYSGLGDVDSVMRVSRNPTALLLNQFEREAFARDLKLWVNRAEAAQQGTEALGVRFRAQETLVRDTAAFAATVRRSDQPQSEERAKAVSEILRLFDELTTASLGSALPDANDREAPARLAVSVRFESGAIAFFHEHSVLTVLRADAEEPVEIQLKDLGSGDRVVFVDKSVGRTIYELMQEHLGESPVVGAAAQVVSLWHRAIAAAQARAALSPPELLARLRASGSTITTVATVRNWLRAVVLGPQNHEDIDRLAAILQIGLRHPSVIDNIKASVRSLRNVYRQFAKIVYRTILSGGAGRRLSDSELALVEEHGVSLTDLREAVTIETVVSVGAEAEMRPTSLIGIRVDE